MRIFLLNYLLPLALPTVAYLGWVYYCRKRADAGEDPPAVTRGGLFWSVMAGAGLMVAGLAAVALLQGGRPDADYQPPQFKDGEIVGPRFQKQ